MPPELESVLALLTSHRSVLGYLLLSRTHPVSIIRHSGVVFDGEQGRRYAKVIERIVESVQAGLEEVSGGSGIGAGGSDTGDGVRSLILGMFDGGC
jgi:dynein light chain roadblock-type